MTINSHLERYNYNSKTLVLLNNNDNLNSSNDNNAGSSHPNVLLSEFGHRQCHHLNK